MTIPNAPLEGGGESLLFLLADNGGVNAAALLYGKNLTTLNSEYVADLVITLDGESVAMDTSTGAGASIGATTDEAAGSGVDGSLIAISRSIRDNMSTVTSEIVGARDVYASIDARLDSIVASGGNVSSIVQSNATITTGTATIPVDTGDGASFTVGNRVYYSVTGGGVEYGQIASIATDDLTVTTTSSSGTVTASSIIAQISETEYQAATAINYGGGVAPTLSDAIGWVSASSYHPVAHGAAGDGTTDDRASLNTLVNTTMSSGGYVVLDRSYSVQSDMTFPAGVTLQFAQNGQINVATGVTVTINGSVDAGLQQIFSCAGTGTVQFARGSQPALMPEWWGASGSASAATNTAAIQLAILAGVGMTALTSNSALFTTCRVQLNARYTVNTLYIPRFSEIVGAYQTNGFTSTYDGEILVLGRSLSESDWQDIILRNFTILGSISLSSQYGIRAVWTGVGGYSYPLEFRDLHIENIGKTGVSIECDNTGAGLIKTIWDNVQIVNCGLYCCYIKAGVFNDCEFASCRFNYGLSGGFFIEPVGAETSPTENLRFSHCLFEANGKNVGGTADYTVGSFGFKSTKYSNHIMFTSCYFEGNGARAGDTTGAHIYCRHPWALEVNNSQLITSNNTVILYRGGQATIENNYVYSPSNHHTLYLFDTAPVGTDRARFFIGPNFYGQAYTGLAFNRSVSTGVGDVWGHTDTNRYRITPPRHKNLVLRDGIVTTADKAIGYNAVRRLTQNSDGSTTIADESVATICLNTVTALVIITNYSQSQSALFIFTSGGGLTLVSQRGTLFGTSKDTEGFLNVYNESGRFLIQNRSGSNALMAVRFIGCDVMAQSDTGYYELQYIEDPALLVSASDHVGVSEVVTVSVA